MAVAAILNIENRHISPMICWPIATKFGTVTRIDPFDRADRQSYELQDGCGRNSEKNQTNVSFYA